MIGWFFTRAPKSRIKLFNTRGRELQGFEPIQRGVVKLYSCGPTVYDYATIGNLRSYVFSDVLRRTLEYAGYRVTQIVNITDFGHLVSDADEGEDKMIKGLAREGLEPTMENMHALASRYADAFKEDLKALNIRMPHALPRASEHVKGMIAYIEVLTHKGYAYKTSDGVYFDTQKFPSYGVLGGSASAEHSRVGVSSEKHDPRDFALWKFNHSLGWDSPWGKGFPGWHIECTAMSTQYLGKSFDIHTGGIDHIAIHHNNEMAQAEAANGRPYARYWMHNEFITIESARIGKSQGNQIILRQVKERDVSPLAYRYWLLTGHYRQGMNFTWDAVEAAQTALLRARKVLADLKGPGSVSVTYKKRFEEAVFDDLDTPKAIALLWELLKDESVPPGDKRKTVLDFDRVLGLGFAEAREEEGRKVAVLTDVSEEVRGLVAMREQARAAKDFARADELREKIKTCGFILEDTPQGPLLKKL